jgi:hypothetical protein
MSFSRSVFSSAVDSIGYDSDTNEMVVTWKSGRVSRYAGVSEGLAEQASKAPSVGTFLNSDVKPYFDHRYE